MAGERDGRRWFRLVGFTIAGLVVVWLALLGFNLVVAVADLRGGIRAADTARSHAQPADIAAGRPLADLTTARGHFSSAHARLGGPMWAPARLLPVIGRQLRAVTALSGAATEVTQVGIDAVNQVQGVLSGPPPVGPDRVTLVRRLADVADGAARRLAKIQLGPRVALFAPIARGRNELADRLDGLQSGLRRGAIGGQAVADLLTGPSRYLVVAANNAEMRAGSGMFLSVGELDASGGVLNLGPMTTVTDLVVPSGSVPLSGDLADRWGWLTPNQDWRNLMLSPRFDASAQLAAQMWVATGHAPVDGVLAIDPVVLQALLAVTGPVVVANQTITTDNVVAELLHDQYLQFPANEQVPERREQLGAIARAAFDALNNAPLSLGGLNEDLAASVHGRHLMIWSARPDREAAWTASGAAGDLQADSLLVSVLNRGGTKLDWFLHASSDISFQAAGANTDVTLRVVLDNRVPPGEPLYVAGPHVDSGVGAGVYLGILTATLPGSARDAHIDGVDQLAVVGADGPTRVVGFQLTVNPGESRTVVVRFVLPGHTGTLTVEPSGRVPGMSWTSSGQHWGDDGSHRIAWQAQAKAA